MFTKVENVDINSVLYPTSLKNIPNPPKKLFIKGNIREGIFDNCLGVVGSRVISLYGIKCIKSIFNTLDLSSIRVVSGFMSGVDYEAHLTTVILGGITIAVLPCGIDFNFLGEFKKLFEKILIGGGLIISEFEGDVPPRKWSYPRRNRIVAGLCDVVFVVEARLNSGSLNTVSCARKYGKSIVCLPTSIFSPYCDAYCQLIGEGASTVKCGFDVNKLFFSSFHKREENSASGVECISITKEGRVVVDLLKEESLTVDELSVYLKIPLNKVYTIITPLVLNGIIEESNGRYYVC